MCSATRSIILSLYLAHGGTGTEEGIKAARIEEDSQIATWGAIPGTHGIIFNNRIKAKKRRGRRESEGERGEESERGREGEERGDRRREKEKERGREEREREKREKKMNQYYYSFDE